MKLGVGQFFEIDANSLMAGTTMPMPVYVLLPLNGRYVPISSFNEKFEGARAAKIRKLAVRKLFVPEKFRKEYEKYWQDCQARLKADEEVALAKKVILSNSLSGEAKAEMLSELARDLLQQAGNATWSDDDPFANKVNGLLEAVLKAVGEEKPFYQHALELKRLKAISEFSVYSSLITFLVAMCQRITAPEDLADICLASLYRDIGNFSLAKDFLGARRDQLDPAQQAECEKHIEHSLKICEKLQADLPQQIKGIIQEHHERFDGTGYPAKLWHHQIKKESQIIHCADLLSLMMQGKLDGVERKMPAAIEYLFEECNKSDNHKPINPDIIYALRYRNPLETEKAA